jgi:hypothetical protein
LAVVNVIHQSFEVIIVYKVNLEAQKLWNAFSGKLETVVLLAIACS